MNSTSTCLPHQLTNSNQMPADTAAVSVTLQQTAYRIQLIEFEKPITRELPSYIDVNDPQWSADPRVQPCIRHTASSTGEHSTANGIGLNFYSSGSNSGGTGSDRRGEVEQPRVSDTGMITGSQTSTFSADVPTMHYSNAQDGSSVESSMMNSVCNVSDSVAYEDSVNLSQKLENSPVDVVKTEPVDINDATSAPAARHTFQHNISWLSVTRSSGVQKLSHTKN